MKTFLLILCLTAAALAQSPENQPRSKPRDIKLPQGEYDAIKAEMEDLAKAWNSGDIPGMSAHMADDMAFVSATGAALSSRKELDQHHAELMKKHFAGSRRTLTVRQIRFIRPRVGFCDVEEAISRYKSLPAGLSARPGQPLRLLTRYLLTKEGRDWVIAAGQSTVMRSPKP